MNAVRSYVQAFRQAYTYDLRRNTYMMFGLLWGLPIPIFSITLDLSLSGVEGRTPFQAVMDHPIHLFFLAHPVLFALVFGAMGTVRHQLQVENERLIARLREEAISDPLTGLYNRRYVFEAFKNALSRAQRSIDSLTVVLLDLDGFKAINEEQGYPAGDKVLREVAQALQGVLRSSDILGRYGGDEFILILPEGLDGTVSLLERAEESVRTRTGLGFSAGIARWPEDGDSSDKLISSADAILARAKKKVHETKFFPPR